MHIEATATYYLYYYYCYCYYKCVEDGNEAAIQVGAVVETNCSLVSLSLLVLL